MVLFKNALYFQNVMRNNTGTMELEHLSNTGLYFKSSHWRCSVRKGVFRNFAKLTGNHLCQSLVFNKVAGLKPATLLKKGLWHRCFPVNFAKLLRTPFFAKHFQANASIICEVYLGTQKSKNRLRTSQSQKTKKN